MNAQLVQAYKNATHMVRKTKQVIMLYDGVIKFLQRARTAIEERNIQDRYNNLTQAAEIVTGLQVCLDFDNGGEVARLLYDYYAGLDARISSIHRSEDLTMLDSCIRDLKTMREAWDEVDTHEVKQNQEESESMQQSALEAAQCKEDQADDSNVPSYNATGSGTRQHHMPRGAYQSTEVQGVSVSA